MNSEHRSKEAAITGASDTTARVHDAARRARRAARELSGLAVDGRRAILEAFADRLDANRERILAANSRDVAVLEPLVEAGDVSFAMLERLKLDGGKLDCVIEGVRQVARLEDPLGVVTLARELDDGLRLTRVSCPIGVIGVIFESRPDALVQISSLAVMSGNGALLKGGSEAAESNAALFALLGEALGACGMSTDVFALLGGREDVAALLTADGLVDLIIPRGSNAFVRHIQLNTTIPVLGHAEGLCHVYVDESADPAKALRIAVDSKAQYPAACNAAETILVHSAIAPRIVADLVTELTKAGVEVRGDERVRELAGEMAVREATDADWSTEYGDLVVAMRIVDSLDEAVEHIASHGSAHTDVIVTESRDAFERFFRDVDSAGVFWNASSRFADGFRYGFGAEVGIATGKLHPRGPVGLEGLVTYKYRLVGDGHVVSDYAGPGGRRFTHRPIED